MQIFLCQSLPNLKHQNLFFPFLLLNTVAEFCSSLSLFWAQEYTSYVPDLLEFPLSRQKSALKPETQENTLKTPQKELRMVMSTINLLLFPSEKKKTPLAP